MIQELFRRPDRPPPRRVYSDEDSGSGSDMEAGLSDVEEEEQRALRVARREDELAEREERERKARKEKLRKEREGR
jgi:protein SPT2